MKALRLAFIAAGILLLVGAGAVATAEELQNPPGIGTLLTSEGPVFVDAKGMTLYKTADDTVPGHSACTDAPYKPPVGPSGEPDPVPEADLRQPCSRNWPPLIADGSAKPIGKWSMIVREDGSKQWAYDGHPLYLSSRDKLPGQTNGAFYDYWNSISDPSWTVAAAPSVGVPAGIRRLQTRAGLVLADAAGKAMYTYDPDSTSGKPSCAGECARIWSPVGAPSDGNNIGDWSIINREDGSKQWALKGKPLYVRNGDFQITDIGAQEKGPWRVVSIMPAPRYPQEIRTQKTIGGEVYSDPDGMTLYAFFCRGDSLCDDSGSSSAYWLNLCGGEERCAKTWRPLRAPKDANPVDGLWSVMVINPRDPLRRIAAGQEGISVWAYKGRPVFTYARDHEPGDLNGTGCQTSWFTLPVYGGCDTSRRHVCPL